MRFILVLSLGGLLLPFYGGNVIWGMITVLAGMAFLGKKGLRFSRPDGILRGWTKSPPLRNLGLFFLAPFLFLGMMEWAAEIATSAGIVKFHVPTQTRLLKRRTEDWRMVHVVMGDEYRIADPVLLWRPIRRHPYNAQGFKGPLAARPKPPDVYRVICYGDSNTDGPERGSWPEVLGRLLDESPVPGSRRYEVLNAGVVGYSSYQGLRRFQEDVKTYEPDLIFVSFGWNDLPDAVGKPDKLFRIPPFVPLVRFLVHYKFYRALMHYVREARGGAMSEDERFVGPRVSLDDYIENMEGFLKEARSHGTDVVFLTRPHERKEDELMEVSGWRSRVPLYNEALRAWARERDAHLIDIQKIFGEQYPNLFGDEAHFELEGHEQMARILYGRVFSPGLPHQRF